MTMTKVFSLTSTRITKGEILAFLAFYLVSTFGYFALAWFVYGGFVPNQPPYFNWIHFWATGGAEFTICLLISLPVWYIVVVRMQGRPIWQLLIAHLPLSILFLVITQFLLVEVKDFYGWAFIWGGRNVVWIYYVRFLFYVVQFGLIHAYVFHKRYSAELADKAALREAVLQSEITALKAQINPHFLHNLFNSINASIPPENERTRELIIQLSDLFRYQNQASQRELVSVEEEISFLRNYLDLLKVRFKERLRITIKVAPEILAYQIPPMLLQPLVENAVAHGIGPKTGPQSLEINAGLKGGRPWFEVTDSGSGIVDKEAAFDRGLGLSNVRLRLRKSLNSDLILADNTPCGLRVSFTL